MPHRLFAIVLAFGPLACTQEQKPDTRGQGPGVVYEDRPKVKKPVMTKWGLVSARDAAVLQAAEDWQNKPRTLPPGEVGGDSVQSEGASAQGPVMPAASVVGGKH
jgi:hypothetical protein